MRGRSQLPNLTIRFYGFDNNCIIMKLQWKIKKNCLKSVKIYL